MQLEYSSCFHTEQTPLWVSAASCWTSRWHTEDWLHPVEVYRSMDQNQSLADKRTCFYWLVSPLLLCLWSRSPQAQMCIVNLRWYNRLMSDADTFQMHAEESTQRDLQAQTEWEKVLFNQGRPVVRIYTHFRNTRNGQMASICPSQQQYHVTYCVQQSHTATIFKTEALNVSFY